jgi:chemotaxis signal transduction protein
MAAERYLVAELGPLAVGLDLADVTEVAPLEPAVRVPWAPTCVRGAVEHQGRLTTLVDLAALLGLDTSAAPRVAVFIDRPELPVALCVAGVHIVEARDAVRNLAPTTALPQSGWIIDALMTPTLAFEHVDLDRVLAAIEAAFRGR